MTAQRLPFWSTAASVIKTSFKELYKSLGFTLLISLIWFFAYFPFVLVALVLPTSGLVKLVESLHTGTALFSHARFAFFIGSIGASLINAFWTAPITTALYGLYELRKDDYINVKSFFTILRKVYTRSAGLFFLYSLANVLFVFNILSFFVERNFFFGISGLVSGYFMLFGICISYYFHPLLYLNYNVKAVFKKAMLLMFDNTRLTMFFIVITALFLLISSVIPPLLFFFFGAFMIYMIGGGFEFIWGKYEQ